MIGMRIAVDVHARVFGVRMQPRMMRKPVPKGVRAAPGRVCTTLTGSPKVPGTRRISSMVIVRLGHLLLLADW